MNFPKPGAKRRCVPCRTQGGGREGDRNSIGSCTGSGVCLSCVFPGKESRHALCPGLRWGVSLVSGRWQLEGKKPSGYLCRAGPLVAEGGFVVEGIRGGSVKNQMYGGKK